MHLFEENIKNLGLNIPDLPKALANYVPYKLIGKTIYISGQAPVQNGELIYKGKVGSDISIEEGIEAAKLCVINIIAALKTGLEGDWDKLTKMLDGSATPPEKIKTLPNRCDIRNLYAIPLLAA